MKKSSRWNRYTILCIYFQVELSRLLGLLFFITFKTVLVIYVGLVNEVHGYSNF